MRSILKRLMMISCLTLVFQGCDDDSSTTASTTTSTAISTPTTYDFSSRFIDGESSVSYTGQVVRNVLIKDLKKLASSGSAATDSATMTDLFRNGGASTADILNPELQTKWSDFDNTKNLSGKIASESLIGFGKSPTDQMYEWFAMVANGTLITLPDSLELNQVIGKGLSGVVGYYQGTSVYMSKIDTDDNSVAAGTGKAYTDMEHHWDESFGYFGAARDYNVNYTDAGLKSKEYKYDTNGDGSIDYKTEYCFDWAYYAGKWDANCSSCTEDNDFTGKIMNAYLEGRTLIHNQAPLADILAQRDIVVNTWEQLVVASVIGYINSVISKMSSTPTQSIYHSWAEMRAFAMALQYNSFSTKTSDITTVVTNLGTAPPKPADYSTYKTILEGAKTTLQTAYGFNSTNMAAW